MKIAATTLGCKVNFYDTDALLAEFSRGGWQVVNFDEPADVYLINTCAVTNEAEKKSRQAIRRASGGNVVVTGCYAKTADINIDGVIVLPREKVFVEMTRKFGAEEFIGAEFIKTEKLENSAVYKNGRQRAYIKVQDGCDNFCAYCIVPYARGRAQSRVVKDVVLEAERVAESGCKEIVLTGICLSNFGKDIGAPREKEYGSLIDLIGAVCGVDGIERVRLSSLEPTIMTKEFVVELAKFDKVCPHFHLSLQSGSDAVLRAMNRKYSAAGYEAAAARVRAAFDDCSLTTDIIAGFPNETDDDFRQTLKFAEKMGFMKIHAFPYSPKKGTKAAEMAGQIPKAVRLARTAELLKLGDKLSEKIFSRYVGAERKVLVENLDEKTGFYNGYTDNYIPVKIMKKGIENVNTNDIALIKLVDTKGKFMLGECIYEP